MIYTKRNNSVLGTCGRESWVIALKGCVCRWPVLGVCLVLGGGRLSDSTPSSRKPHVSLSPPAPAWGWLTWARIPVWRAEPGGRGPMTCPRSRSMPGALVRFPSFASTDGNPDGQRVHCTWNVCGRWSSLQACPAQGWQYSEARWHSLAACVRASWSDAVCGVSLLRAASPCTIRSCWCRGLLFVLLKVCLSGRGHSFLEQLNFYCGWPIIFVLVFFHYNVRD